MLDNNVLYILQMRDVMLITNANSTNRSHRRPVFAYGCFSGLVHGDMNEAAHMDKLLERFFQSLYDSGSLENTVVVLFSDHGPRFGRSRANTRMGWYEENLPMALIAMPESFRSRHAAMMKTLRSNRRKLTTPLDLHETIRRVLDIGKPYDDRLRVARGRRGVSLFDVTLGDRTCKDASIAPAYCECQLSRTHPVDARSSQVSNVLNELVFWLSSLQLYYINLRSFISECTKFNVLGGLGIGPRGPTRNGIVYTYS